MKTVHFFLCSCLLMLSLAVTPFEAVDLGTDRYQYYVDEGDNARVECFINCIENSTHTVDWRIQVPRKSESRPIMLDDDSLGIKRIKQYVVQISKDDSVNCTNGSRAYFFLNITGVKTDMNHSVLHCGETSFHSIWLDAAIYLFVERIDPVVMATSEVNYATDNEVTISCRHSCNWTSLHSNYLLLWKLNTFYYRYLEAIELHDNHSKTTAENELKVKFSMTSDDGCSLGNNFSTFSLNIMNVSASLQHAVVSCGVRVDMDSPEIYSSTDTRIVINETNTECITTDTATAPTTSNEATTSTTSADMTTPTTNETAIAEPPDRVVEIAVPASIASLLFGLATGALVSGVAVCLLTRRTKLDKMAEAVAAHNVEMNMAVAASNPINKETFEESEQPPVEDCR